jgi:Flp pilus assembly pilin Flp
MVEFAVLVALVTMIFIRQEGATMAENALLLAVVAVVAVASLSLFGTGAEGNIEATGSIAAVNLIDPGTLP